MARDLRTVTPNVARYSTKYGILEAVSCSHLTKDPSSLETNDSIF